MKTEIIYSKGCTHKRPCMVEVMAWHGKTPVVYFDPHECGQCHRRYKIRLSQSSSGDYFCFKKDCFETSLKSMLRSPAIKKYFGKFLKEMKANREKIKRSTT